MSRRYVPLAALLVPAGRVAVRRAGTRVLAAVAGIRDGVGADGGGRRGAAFGVPRTGGGPPCPDGARRRGGCGRRRRGRRCRGRAARGTRHVRAPGGGSAVADAAG